MNIINIDKEWTFRRGFLDSLGMMETDPGVIVNLPHDGMISTEVSPDAPAGVDSGYFTGGMSNYTKYIFIPKEWENECVGLRFDGVMQCASVEVNGSKAAYQHNGYIPFYVDLTNYVTFGSENRITINVNTSMQPNSRWYTGSGLYRGASLCHGPRVHIVTDGIFISTKEVADGYAFLSAQVEVENMTTENRVAEVSLFLYPEGSDECVAETKQRVHIGAVKRAVARLSMNVKNPSLWDADNPNLYRVKAVVKDMGVYRTHLIKNDVASEDEAETLFGIRTITADAVRGLRINGKSVKLKGGCIHHDNGILGSITLYEAEARKIRKLKESGFNAVRTAHNPPSAALIEACDRVGMYVFDEAFDAWNMGKRGGDYSQYFDSDWEKDLSAFIKRDRSHPSVILWSTGNEIPERGGLSNGYTIADRLAGKIRELDGTRPISNGICSMWSGLDDELMKGQSEAQNSDEGLASTQWGESTEPFANGLDVVGYNYMEDIYERDHTMFPERVILGSENFPKEVGYRWPFIEKLPYVIGEFTWTAWDYIGEAGIGKDVYYDKDDPDMPESFWDLMPQTGSPFPWRTANDADFDITGYRLPQGAYRSVVWGNDNTYLYSMHPDTYGKVELISLWGFLDAQESWNYHGYEGRMTELVVFSRAEEVEIFIDGKSIGRKQVCMDRPLPYSVRFETEYKPGKVEAVSYRDGKEVSRAELSTTDKPDGISLTAEKTAMKADGHDLIYVNVDIVDENGNRVPDAKISLKAELTGPAVISGFGSANPVTDEKYTDAETVSYKGRALAVLRSGYEKGQVRLNISGEGVHSAEVTLDVE